MLENLNFWEIGALVLLALFIFGPERLPKVISDGLRMLRNVREMARNATRDLSREIGTEVTLEDLHPKTFIRKHLLTEEDEAQIRRPFEDAYQDVRQITAETNDVGAAITGSGTGSQPRYGSGPYDGSYDSTYDGTPAYDSRSTEGGTPGGVPAERSEPYVGGYEPGRPYDGQTRGGPPPESRDHRTFDSDAT
jgi:sec-independent protein translocase protein TatB